MCLLTKLFTFPEYFLDIFISLCVCVYVCVCVYIGVCGFIESPFPSKTSCVCALVSVPSLFYFQCSKILRLFSLTIWSLPSLVASPDRNIAALRNPFRIILKRNYRWTRWCSEFLFIWVRQNISDAFLFLAWLFYVLAFKSQVSCKHFHVA